MFDRGMKRSIIFLLVILLVTCIMMAPTEGFKPPPRTKQVINVDTLNKMNSATKKAEKAAKKAESDIKQDAKKATTATKPPTKSVSTTTTKPVSKPTTITTRPA
jgi:hypothetical protein